MTSRTGPDRLLVFLKQPLPGAVKSRLADGIGPVLAAAVARALAEHALARTAPLGDEYERLVFFAPAHARDAIAEWLPGQDCRPQADGDLGARMADAFEQAFRAGARRVVLVGTDVPGIGREDVREAFESLDAHDVVIGPASDGGYWLLALGDPAPALFRDVPWSTPRVLETTLARAARLPRGVRVLRTLGDVDTAADLAADWDRIAALLPAGVRAEVAARLGREPDPTTGR
jgi:uncharacterized protein